MRVLYAIQATGNGHLARALEIIPVLKKYCDLDIFVSGIQGDIKLPYPIKYQKYGMSFIFGKNGGVDVKKSLSNLKMINFIKDVKANTVADYDLVINDFEPITAWNCKLKNTKSIGLSHQSSFLSGKVPRPKKRSNVNEFILDKYAPSNTNIAFHFEPYDDFIHTPIIRRDVRKLSVSMKEHITVYLPSIGDDVLITYLSQIEDVKWEVFSKHAVKNYNSANIKVSPISDKSWLNSLASCKGVVMGAGFEGPAEAMYLGKKLLVIPMHNQYEQLCNAEALKQIGVKVLDKLEKCSITEIEDWIYNGEVIHKDYPDEIDKIIANIFDTYN